MSINQLIAGGIQLPRFESPINMMAQLSQLEAAREANELRKMQMAQMQREQAIETALMQIPTEELRADPMRAISIGGRRGLPYVEALRKAERDRQEAELSKAKFEDVQTQRVAPKPTEIRLGDRIAFVDTNPQSPTFNQLIRQDTVGAAPESDSLRAQRQAAMAASQAAGAASGARLAQIQAQMGAAARSETAPKPMQVQLGNRVAIVDTNPLSTTFNQEVSSLEVGARPLSTIEQQRAQAAIEAYKAATGLSQTRTEDVRQRMSAAERDATTPKPMQANLGDTVAFFDMNPRSATFGQRLAEGAMGVRPMPGRTPEQKLLDEARAEQIKAQAELTRIRTMTEEMRQAGTLPGDKLAQERIENERRRLTQAESNANLAERRLNLATQQAERAADPDFQFSIANARAKGTASAKSDQDAKDNLPSAIAEANRAIANIDEMVGRPAVKDESGKVVQPATRPHPGFENVVGFTFLPGMRFVPGTPAADFYARFQQTQGQSFLQAYETLKGGGHITDTEGNKATAAINRMSIAQSEREFITAARELQEIVRTGATRAQKRLESIGGANAPAAAPAAAPSPRGAAGGEQTPVNAPTRPQGVGADWTFMVDGKGNRAWVSPDKKQVREVR